MDGNLIWQILLIGVFIMVLVRMYPTAKHWLENGPKGSASDWISAAIAIVAVIVFILVLMSSVRS
ncbi:MAG: hypothetical protein ACNYPI_02350 [Arenicellales bacterium WSBS_2016_MAG_OTU3]